MDGYSFWDFCKDQWPFVVAMTMFGLSGPVLLLLRYMGFCF